MIGCASQAGSVGRVDEIVAEGKTYHFMLAKISILNISSNNFNVSLGKKYEKEYYLGILQPLDSPFFS